jgi:hypothetical protein
MVTNNDTTRVQQFAEPFVSRDPHCESGAIRIARRGQVPFDAEVAEERGAGAEVQDMLATSGVGHS